MVPPCTACTLAAAFAPGLALEGHHKLKTQVAMVMKYLFELLATVMKHLCKVLKYLYKLKTQGLPQLRRLPRLEARRRWS